ncbi:hypothetical protein ACHAW5_001009 [Stephanodiscus triporus]|uniref:HSF-type DNA-binding domain-containing protein n=1 Tax=Stephanodiscus triporus TaxID=2934178 RepID=A0ABD3NZF1_9STRA
MNNNSPSLKYVDHTYRDFSRYVEEGGELPIHKKSANNFPARLHKILSETDPNYSDIIAWMPHGRAWKIYDKNRFISDVIPKYYDCKKYESFTRQLSGWGFKRLHQSGYDCGCYYHECFLRGLPELTCLIRRLPTNLGKTIPYVEGEPHFYAIGMDYPLPPPPRDAPRTLTQAMPGALSGVMPEKAIAVTIGSRPPKVVPATIDRHATTGRPRVTSVDLPSSSPSINGKNMGNLSPASSITSDVYNPQVMPPSSSVRVPPVQEPSAPRLVARASTEPSALAPMPPNLSRHPSAPYYYPSYSQYATHNYGIVDQHSGGGNPYLRGGYSHFEHHPQFHFPQGMPGGGDYLRYGGFDHNNGNDMLPPTSYGAMNVANDPFGSERLFRKQEEESSESNDEVDEFEPIPVQYSPRSMKRKMDGNSLEKLEPPRKSDGNSLVKLEPSGP